jgi:hypothetical protein
MVAAWYIRQNDREATRVVCDEMNASYVLNSVQPDELARNFVARLRQQRAGSKQVPLPDEDPTLGE